MFKGEYDTPYDINYKLYTALSSGAKGLVYWQYRAERVGHESDCSGIMHMDGSPREVAYEVKDFGAQLKKDNAIFKDSKAKPAEIAIVFDYDCLLLSEIEDSCGPDYTFGLWNVRYHYKNAHTGMYRLLRDANYAVDYIGVRDVQKFDQYKVLYLPYYTMIKPDVADALKAFIEKGGIVIADEGFGIRTVNTWMQPYDIDFKPVLNARRKHRVFTAGEKVSYEGLTATVQSVKTDYDVQNAEVLARFDDGKPAMFKIEYGKGAFYLSGFGLGYGYCADKNELYSQVVEDILANTDVCKYVYADVQSGLYEKRLQINKGELVFLFNATEEDKVVEMKEQGRLMSDCGTFVDGKLTIPPFATVYFMAEE
jgi:beta-galactosidase GanA